MQPVQAQPGVPSWRFPTSLAGDAALEVYQKGFQVLSGAAFAAPERNHFLVRQHHRLWPTGFRRRHS